MDKKFKIGSIAFIGLVFVVSFTMFLVMSAGDMSTQDSLAGSLITLVFWLIGIGILAVVANAIVNLLADMKKLVKVGISLVALVVIFGISYGIADNQEVYDFQGKLLADQSVSAMSGAMLNMFYIMLTLLLALIVSSPIIKTIKK